MSNKCETVQKSLFPEHGVLVELSEWLPRKLWLTVHGDEDVVGVNVPLPLVRRILDLLDIPHEDTEPKSCQVAD